MEDEKIIICRCEDQTLSDIRKKINYGITSIEEIKRLTRCGMGPCQGRTCRDLLIKEIAAATGQSIEDVGMTTFRPPVKPIKLKSMLGVDDDEKEC
ncbi:MAG: (2Fe-2S)-binding protein [Firmicutes bacterium]|nr:(2Fe-2S)-binding protein [Bacillota bacterium]